MTQIINLLLLAPDIQVEVLLLPRTGEGGDQVTERSMQAATAEPSFLKQRRIWHLSSSTDAQDAELVRSKR